MSKKLVLLSIAAIAATTTLYADMQADWRGGAGLEPAGYYDFNKATNWLGGVAPNNLDDGARWSWQSPIVAPLRIGFTIPTTLYYRTGAVSGENGALVIRSDNRGLMTFEEQGAPETPSTLTLVSGIGTSLIRPLGVSCGMKERRGKI